ncbi:putative nuclease HARBI1 [Penaeus vannamei]|uniref:putative nuclease HARBI1 n=1 Tax=Penaeus vannamei TaxID=6689 RepID=UPI00387F801C
MATGSFQLTTADTFDVSQQLVSNCTAKIVRAIASLLQDYVKRPSREHFSNIRNYYFEMSGFPGVLCAVDCTHVPIQSPEGARPEEFRCDSAYPLLPFLLTPVANPVGQREIRYYISHSKVRNTIERAFGVLKMRFRCLTIPLKINLTTVMATICSAAVLHNMAVKYKEDLYMRNDDG